MRSPITQLIEDFHQLSEPEQRVFLDLVDPQPETAEVKPKAKRKPRTGSKSPRASNIATTLKKGLDAQRQVITNSKCIFRMTNSEVCGYPENDPIHDPKGGYAGYHEFQAAKAAGAGS